MSSSEELFSDGIGSSDEKQSQTHVAAGEEPIREIAR